jgi:Glycosyl transferases group 1
VRILLSCLQDLRPHPLPAYGFWAGYFRNGIDEAGHEVVEIPDVDWAEGCTDLSAHQLHAWRGRSWTKTLEWIKRELGAGRRIDLFLSYFFPQQIEPAAIRELQKLGIPSVNFFCDNVREFTRVPTEFHCFDLHWVPEYEAIPMYRRANLPYLNAPMPCWIPAQLRSLLNRETEPPTFIGSSDVLRSELFSKALTLGTELVLRGPGWSSDPNLQKHQNRTPRSLLSIARSQVNLVRAHGFKALTRKLQDRLFPLRPCLIPPSVVEPAVWGDEYFRISREATVTLGVNRVPSFRASNRRPLIYSRLRDIEAPMLGACYLTEYTEGLTQLYEIGREVETYRNAEELCTKLKELSGAPKHRASMRERAQRRALSEHSMPQSLHKICEYLGL